MTSRLVIQSLVFPVKHYIQLVLRWCRARIGTSQASLPPSHVQYVGQGEMTVMITPLMTNCQDSLKFRLGEQGDSVCNILLLMFILFSPVACIVPAHCQYITHYTLHITYWRDSLPVAPLVRIVICNTVIFNWYCCWITNLTRHCLDTDSHNLNK